jgi:DNA-binding NarL/FixJ family response regulator
VLKSDAKSHLVAALEAVAQHQPYFTPRISEMVLQGYLKPSNHSGETSLPLERLTPREREILQLVAEGRTSKEIAAALNVSDKTVEAHRANLTNKLNLHSVAELVRYAVRNEIIEA